MKSIEEIKEHLASTCYSKHAKTAIRYWLFGKGVIKESTEILFKNREGNEGRDTFEDFVRWFNARPMSEIIDEVAKALEGLFPEKIHIGDYVKVLDLDNPRDEYVEYVFPSLSETTYLLSDGTWVRGDFKLAKYEAQGERRQELIDELNRVLI